MINNKFLFFSKLKDFEREKRRGNISPLSIVFILDQLTIWTHDTYFSMNTGFEKSKGYFETLTDLLRAYPEPKVGDWAIVGDDIHLESSEEPTVSTWTIANCKEDGHWNLTTQTYEHESLDLSEYVKKSDFDLSNYLKIGDIDLSSYLVRSDLDGYLKSTDLDLSEYAKKSDIPDNVITTDTIVDYIPNDVITTNTIGDYIPEPQVITIDEELSEMSENPVQNAAICEALGSKADKSQLNSYATSEQLQSFQTVLGTKASTSDLELYADNVAAVAAGLNQKVNTSYAEETYAKKTDLAQEVSDEVAEQVASIQQAAEHAKGYFGSDTELNQTVPNPELGDWAIVSSNGQWIIYRCATAGTWTTTGEQYTEDPIDLTLYAKLEDLQGLVTAQQLQQHITAADAKYLTVNDLTGYALSSQVDAQYAKKTELTAHSDYTELTYAKKTELNAHSNYAELTYAKKNELLNFLTNEDVLNFITGLELRLYATTQYVDNNVSALQELIQYLYDKYISWHSDDQQSDDQQGEPEPNPSSLTRNDMVTLTVDEYLELVDTNRVRENTYYFTYIPEVDPNATWGFGDRFPVILTDGATSNMIGLFPINLT